MSARQHAKPRDGLAATELALLLPFLVLMFVGVLDFCRIFHACQVVEGCANTAALYASGRCAIASTTTPTQMAQQAAVAEANSLNPQLKTSDVTVTFAGGNAKATVAYSFQRLIPFPGLPSTITLTRSATLPIVQ